MKKLQKMAKQNRRLDMEIAVYEYSLKMRQIFDLLP